jgi:hypothetical protein
MYRSPSEVQSPASDVAAGRAADPAGRIIRQITVLPTLLAAAWLLAGLPLLALGHFSALPMLAVSIPIAAVLLVVAWRSIPGTGGTSAFRAAAPPTRAPWWSLIALIAVAVAFGADQFAYHSQQIIVQRDPASYIQFGNWISLHGSLPIPGNVAAFGAPARLLTFSSPGFFRAGQSIAPQFMAGLPMVLAAAFWTGGVGTAVATNALLAACGVLALGGLAARLIGPRWAPLAALVLAATLPEQYTARSAFSEPLAQVMFLGGLCLVADALRRSGASQDGAGREQTSRDCAGQKGAGPRWLAALGGLALGLTLLVRIDGASDILPLIPYCGLLFLQRRRQAGPLILGLVLGVFYGVADGLALTKPYLQSIEGSLVPLVFIAIVLLVATAGVAVVFWRRGLPRLDSRWPLRAGAAAPVLIIAGLALRPYVQTVHGPRNSPAAGAVAAFQLADHLPIQPTRLYYEISLHWVFWYAGVPAVILATAGAAVLARRCLQGRAPTWTLPLICFGWAITATLLRPEIIPDQPWASRRLVPAVLPGFILLAVWALAWLADRLRGARRLPRGALIAVIGVALVLPAAQTSFGLGMRSGGPLGVRVVATGLAGQRTYQGEIGAVRHMCAELPADASVITLDTQFEEVIRGMCGLPAASLRSPRRQIVHEVIRDIQTAGRRPVILAATPRGISRLGYTPRLIMELRSRADAHYLVSPPTTTIGLVLTVWMYAPPA